MLNPHVVPQDKCVYYNIVEKTYKNKGIAGIYELYKYYTLDIKKYNSEKVLVIKDGVIEWTTMGLTIMDIIINIMQLRYNGRKIYRFLKKKCEDNSSVNTQDFYYNPFYGIDGNPISEFVTIYDEKKYWNFSETDIRNIFINSLESRDEYIASPTQPKNPYNNIPFNIVNMNKLYNFMLDSSYNKKQPIYDIILRYRAQNFDIDLFKIENETFLEKRAIANWIKSLNDKKYVKYFLIMINYYYPEKSKNIRKTCLLDFLNYTKFRENNNNDLLLINYLHLYFYKSKISETSNLYWDKHIKNKLESLINEIKVISIMMRKKISVSKSPEYFRFGNWVEVNNNLNNVNTPDEISDIPVSENNDIEENVTITLNDQELVINIERLDEFDMDPPGMEDIIQILANSMSQSNVDIPYPID